MSLRAHHVKHIDYGLTLNCLPRNEKIWNFLLDGSMEDRGDMKEFALTRLKEALTLDIPADDKAELEELIKECNDKEYVLFDVF